MRQNFLLLFLAMFSASTTLLRASDAATPEQQISWKAHVDAGPTALEIDARTVVDDPA